MVLLLGVYPLTSPSQKLPNICCFQATAQMDKPPEQLLLPEHVGLFWQSCEQQLPVLQDAAQRQLEGQQEKQERAARRVQKLQRDLRSAGLRQQARHVPAHTFKPALSAPAAGRQPQYLNQRQALQQYT